MNLCARPKMTSYWSLLLLLGIVACFQVSVVSGYCDGCKIKFKALGCYRTGSYVSGYVSKQYKQGVVGLDHWKSFLQQAACKCAALAKKNRRSLFGLTFSSKSRTSKGWMFHGTCWSFSPYDKLKKVSDKQCLKTLYKPCTKLSNRCIGQKGTPFIYKIVPGCDIPMERLGCFADNHRKPRPLPDYYLTDRQKNLKISSGKTIDWRNWDVYLSDLVCRCAKKAIRMGRATFGVQYYGECWTGDNGGMTYKRDGKSKNCVDNCFKPCKPGQKYCVGKAKANFVYRIKGC